MTPQKAAVKERGIIFTAESVRSILDGKKVQTRRPVAVRPWKRAVVGAPASTQPWATVWDNGVWHTWDKDGIGGENGEEATVEEAKDWALKCALRQGFIHCPYGQPGDRLWVRETFLHALDGFSDQNGDWQSTWRHRGPVEYVADGAVPHWHSPDTHRLWMCKRPSIFMPRWASRITLELTDVRVQRVQEISEEDAIAEGVEMDAAPEDYTGNDVLASDCGYFTPRSYRDGFRSLWNTLNEKRGYGWDSNCWVWALSFRPVEREL